MSQIANNNSQRLRCNENMLAGVYGLRVRVLPRSFSRHLARRSMKRKSSETALVATAAIVAHILQTVALSRPEPNDSGKAACDTATR